MKARRGTNRTACGPFALAWILANGKTPLEILISESLIRYVEGLNDARTRLADFFSRLLTGDGTSILRSSLNNLNGHRLPCQLLKDRVAFVPLTMPTVGIDVAGLSNIDEAAAPGLCAVLRKRR